MLRRVALVRIDVSEERSTSIIKVTRRMVFSEMLRRVAHLRTDVSEELSAFIRVTRIGELGTTILHSLRRENLKSYRVTRIGELGRTLAGTIC
jgi:hypothetical protein